MSVYKTALIDNRVSIAAGKQRRFIFAMLIPLGISLTMPLRAEHSGLVALGETESRAAYCFLVIQEELFMHFREPKPKPVPTSEELVARRDAAVAWEKALDSYFPADKKQRSKALVNAKLHLDDYVAKVSAGYASSAAANRQIIVNDAKNCQPELPRFQDFVANNTFAEHSAPSKPLASATSNTGVRNANRRAVSRTGQGQKEKRQATYKRIDLVVPPRKGTNEKTRIVTAEEIDRMRASQRAKRVRKTPATKSDTTEVECKAPFTGYLYHDTLTPRVKIASALNRQQTLAAGNAIADCYEMLSKLIMISNPYAEKIAFTVTDNSGQIAVKNSAPITASRKMNGKNAPQRLPDFLGRWRLQANVFIPEIFEQVEDQPLEMNVTWNWSKSRFEAVLVLGNAASRQLGLQVGENLLIAELATGLDVAHDKGLLLMRAKINNKLYAGRPPENPTWVLTSDGALEIVTNSSAALAGYMYHFRRTR